MTARGVRWLRVAVAALAVSLNAQTYEEQGQGPAPEDGQEPERGRGVARLSLMMGEVSVKHGDSAEWLAAAPNAPLVFDDRIATGNGAAAEVQLDHANFIRMAQNSELRLAEVDYGRFQVQVAGGTVTVRVLRNSEAQLEISTPSVSVRPLQRGSYRITVNPDGTTEVTARSGEAEIYTPRGTERLRGGATLMARGNPADPEFQITGQIPRDGWDDWNDRRDQQLERSQSYRYVSPSVYGAEDLDAHGRWVHDPPYGYVWVPTVAVDWAPYRYGRWVWVDWYGWSWVSYDSWGWAPYHYGRWYQSRFGWCWWPGAPRARHSWSPGLVAWVGFGGGGGVHAGVGFGRVGWIPLAPHEPYYRWYGSGYYGGYRNRTYVNNNVNITNVNITNVYRNARVTNGITAVDTGDFRNGRYTAARLTEGDFHNAALVRGQVPLTPERANLRMADREAGVQGRSGDQGRFFSRRAPATVDRVPFEEQRRGVEEVRRRTFGEPSATTGIRPVTPTDGGARTADRPARSADGGWRRFGDPSDRTGAPVDRNASRPADNNTRDRGGWRRFGDPAASDGGQQQRQARPPSGWRNDTPRQETPRPETRPTETPADRSTGREGGRVRDQSFRANDGGWRRFGDSGTAPPPSDNGVSPSIVRERGQSRSEGWKPDTRMIEARPARIETPRIEAPRVEAPRMQAPARTEAPRMEAPRMEAPRMERHAPARMESRTESSGGGNRSGGEGRGGGGGRHR